MKSLRGSLSFVVGIIVGIVLFVTAIGGSLVAIGLSVKVGKIQDSLTSAEIIDKESELYDSTLLDAVIMLYDDIQNYDQLTMERLYNDFGIKYVKEIGGVDFSNKPFYTLKLGDLISDISVVTNSFTLNDVGDLAGINFADYNIPIITENSSLGITSLIDKLMSSVNGKISIRFIKDNFVPDFDVDSNSILNSLQDLTLDNIGSTLNSIPLRRFLDLDINQYLLEGTNTVYVKTGRYEQITSADLSSTYKPSFGVKTFISGVDSSNNLIEKELRYVKMIDSNGNEYYKVDKSSYDEGFDPATNETAFYRYIEYEPYSSTFPGDGDYYVISYGNHINNFSGTDYTLTPIGFFNLNSIYKESDHTAYKGYVTSGSVTIGNSTYKDETETYISSSHYCVSDSPITLSSKLIEDSTKSKGASSYYVLGHKGTTDAAFQTLAFSSINSISGESLLDSYKLGDILTIDSSSSTVMQALKDYKISELGNAVDDLTIDQVLSIDSSSSQVLQSLKARGTKISQMSTAIDDLTIDEIITIDDSSSKLMKSLKARGTKIPDLATIANDLLISEMLDIYNNYAVQEADSSTASNFILAPSKENGEYQLVDGKKITYTLDNNGKYILSPIKFTPATVAQLGTPQTGYWQWQKINTIALATAKTISQNIYIKHNGEYYYNTILSSYLMAKNPTDAGIAGLELYYREVVGDSSKTAYTYYDNSTEKFYVDFAGTKVLYDKDNPAHSDIDIFYLNDSEDDTTFKYFVPLDEYRHVRIKSTLGGGYTYDLSGTLSKTGTEIYTEGVSKQFTRQFCENIYVKTNDTLNTFVFINGEYVAYDSTNAIHQGLDRFKIIEGYYATKAESYDAWSLLNTAGVESIYGVESIREKTAPVLRTMAQNDAKINDLSSVLTTAKVKDLIDLSPDSIFNNPVVKDSTIDGISDSIKAAFTTMTIGGFCDWANITDVDAQVKSTLNGVTLVNFFQSLKYDSSIGIYVDMVSLFLPA